jgi:hypothetical protein
MKFGATEAFIDGGAEVKLTGEHKGIKWSWVNSSNEVVSR